MRLGSSFPVGGFSSAWLMLISLGIHARDWNKKQKNGKFQKDITGERICTQCWNIDIILGLTNATSLDVLGNCLLCINYIQQLYWVALFSKGDTRIFWHSVEKNGDALRCSRIEQSMFFWKVKLAHSMEHGLSYKPGYSSMAGCERKTNIH